MADDAWHVSCLVVRVFLAAVSVINLIITFSIVRVDGRYTCVGILSCRVAGDI